jgi:glutaredoxin
MAKLVRVVLAALVALVVFLWLRRQVDVSNFSTDITLYGSHTCPWCNKQEEHFKRKNLSYRFVDCPTETCPEFVKSFPTIVVNDEVFVGYTDKI